MTFSGTRRASFLPTFAMASWYSLLASLEMALCGIKLMAHRIFDFFTAYVQLQAPLGVAAAFRRQIRVQLYVTSGQVRRELVQHGLVGKLQQLHQKAGPTQHSSYLGVACVLDELGA